ncbi:polyketide synthase family protein [Saccharomonospora marina XMU15]|uniref:Polyketide synthase family protein n=1 Tax=Saccharomonospora marina XMU15 TaxID=882083 RepID=H5X7U0_9PSEU|nr:type I polyketide synthase [Saccharomonospora marina]EHR52440.1 polyketide synthase family protein [Saccharomonospora marina XMU15]
MDRDRSMDTAVVGISARLPGVHGLDDWWSVLTSGQVRTKRFEPRELLDAGVPAGLLDDPEYVPVHGYLDHADEFDNTLFRMSARDAEMLDPQHRLMLQGAWAALEDAGTGFGAHRPVTAVFASSSGSGYLRRMLVNGELDPVVLEEALHGTEPDFVAGLIAYKLGLTGPAIAVQTACSSSLVGVHLACQALAAGDCDQAVVAGAGVAFPQAGYLRSPGGIQSRTGRCRPFDRESDGVVAGSGVVCVVLRRLSDVLDHGPEPYGVILGSAVNNDGAAKAGFYAPSAAAQEAVIRAALDAADVSAASLGYLEAHGTGTRIGDPIEWTAATAALHAGGAPPGSIALGALKANIGHLDAAAGLAALVKALFVLRNGVVPPIAGYTGPNPLLETAGSPLRIPTEAEPWRGPEPRRAGVSAFGIGGTNVHVVVEQASPAPLRQAVPDRRPRLVLLSAAEEGVLATAATRLAEHLATTEVDLADVSTTLATGRAALPERLAVVGRSIAEVADRLRAGAGAAGRVPQGGSSPVVFLFPGQGTQYPGMALAFAEVLPGFLGALQLCLIEFPADVRARVRAALLDRDSSAADLATTELAQPALFALGYTVASGLAELGVVPAAVLGHSLGEITAACVAGILDLPSAARFVVERGRIMQGCPPGAMLALGCDEARTRELLSAGGAHLDIAAVNGPDNCVVAGPAAAVAEFGSWLGDRVHTRRLATERAFHSALVDRAVPALAEAAGDLVPRPARVAFAANWVGEVLPPGSVVAAEDFVRQARRPVRFADGLGAVAAGYPGCVAVEAGPGRTLATMATALGTTAVPLSPHRGGTDGAEAVLAALGRLWAVGGNVDTGRLCVGGHRARLPTYPFAGRRWLAPEVVGASDAGTGSGKPPVPDDGPPDVPAVVSRLWTELLGSEAANDHADFFHLGGDSLLVVHLVRRLHRELGVTVSPQALLEGRTLGGQTAAVLASLGSERI